MSADARISAITTRIIERSKPTRERYLGRLHDAALLLPLPRRIRAESDRRHNVINAAVDAARGPGVVVVAAEKGAAAKGAVAAAPKGDSSNSAMAISVIPVSAATTAITDDADAISVDAADSVRRTDRAVAEEAVVVAADKSKHLAHRSLP